MKLQNLSLPVIFALLGYIFTTKYWILWLNKLNPIQGLIVYYIAIYITIYSLQMVGLVVAGKQLLTGLHAFGSVLIIFSWFIIFDWTSSYISYIINNNGDISTPGNIYLESEDGSVYYLWNKIFNFSPTIARILTYVVTPAVLTFIGLQLINGPLELSYF